MIKAAICVAVLALVSYGAFDIYTSLLEQSRIMQRDYELYHLPAKNVR